MQRKKIFTADAPAAIGPYSQAIRSGQFIFTSGQVALNPATGELVGTDVTAQTERVFQNVEAVLAAAGATLANVVKTTVFLTSMGDFAAMNAVYERYFGKSGDPNLLPARSTVAVAELPRKALVEIECVAIVED